MSVEAAGARDPVLHARAEMDADRQRKTPFGAGLGGAAPGGVSARQNSSTAQSHGAKSGVAAQQQQQQQQQAQRECKFNLRLCNFAVRQEVIRQDDNTRTQGQNHSLPVLLEQLQQSSSANQNTASNRNASLLSQRRFSSPRDSISRAGLSGTFRSVFFGLTGPDDNRDNMLAPRPRLSGGVIDSRRNSGSSSQTPTRALVRLSVSGVLNAKGPVVLLSPLLGFGNFECSSDISVPSTAMLDRFVVTFTLKTCANETASQGDKIMHMLGQRTKLGQCSIDLRTLAVGPQRHDILLALADSQLAESYRFRLSFDSVISQITTCVFTIRKIEVSLLESAIRDEWRRHQLYAIASFLGNGKVREISSDATLRGNKLILNIPRLAARASMEELVSGQLVLELHDSSANNLALGYVIIPMIKYWQCKHKETALVVEELVGCDRHSGEQRNVIGTVRLKLSLSNAPSLSQMKGGIHTEAGITDARPLVFGVLLPSGSRTDSTLRSGLGSIGDWIRLIDSFGLEFFYNPVSGTSSWTNPHRPGSGYDQADTDAQRPLNEKILPGGISVFTMADGSTRFLHPGLASSQQLLHVDCFGDVSRPSWMSPLSIMDGHHDQSALLHGVTDNSEPMPDGGVNTDEVVSSTSAVRDTELMLLAQQARSRAVAVAQACMQTSADDVDQINPVARITDDSGCATEMKWSKLLDVGYLGEGSEGHSLIPVNGGAELYKYGGGCGRDWFNKLFAFDVNKKQWRYVVCNGPAPLARTGHCAISLAYGARMLVFGGTSRTGRLNCLDVLDVPRSTWSPVNLATAHVPSKRSRAAMCAMENGTSALLFAGREGYRFLGDKYYNDLHIFDASRVEWLAVKDRGFTRPEPRAGHIGEMINNRQLFVHGGMDDGAKFYSDSWLFDTVSMQWTRTPYPDEPSPGTRESHASALVGGAVVSYGGNGESGQLYNDVWVFNTANLRWAGVPLTTGPSPGVRTGAAMAPLDDRSLLVVGGDSGFSYLKDCTMLEVAYTSLEEVRLKTQACRERGPQSDTCVICLDRAPQAMFLWCSHYVCCRVCAAQVQYCPMCREYIYRKVLDT
ncbi:Tip elongation aberrant protein 1 [Porphyridium purpureum]|uniref:Tip elongation aberrant protein 1 n=1 Tax=Porphyridium purpureum TaxID=35688 RepID=A0A5J4YTJ1_PORPP|nr:Tip elongation aberrant protein 1 [Porphyridium purpureum]|eukprot:POR4829..scf227_4